MNETIVDRHARHDVSACQWNKRLCRLSLHYEHGFALYSESDHPARLLWQEPFEKLYLSSDDNDHLLRLDFHGEEGTVVSRSVSLPTIIGIDEIF